MATRKTRSKSISLRPNLTVYEAIDPGLYHALVSLPEDVRGEFIVGVLKLSALGIASPMPCPPGMDRPLFAGLASQMQPSAAEDPPKTHRAPSTVPPPGSLEPAAPRGLESLGFDSMDAIGDAFVYDNSSRRGP